MEEVAEWANKVEEVSKLKPGERRSTILELLKHRNGMIATFAVQVICDELSSESMRARTFERLEGLPKLAGVSIEATIEADRQLLAFPGWADYTARDAYFRLWTGPLSSADADKVVFHIVHKARLPRPERTAQLVRDVLASGGDHSVYARKLAARLTPSPPTTSSTGWNNF